MEPHLSTTPFGRRSLTLAHVAAQQVAKSRPPEKAVHKWNVFRAICTAKPRIGISERALSVLNALLTFYPETVLTGEDLIVFPSNRQLALRAHGMAPATLRRHLAALVDAGLIFQSVDYTRVDSGGNVLPKVSSDNGILPLPFLGLSYRPDILERRLTFAFGLFVPYTGIPRYPDNGPQRYSLVSLDGTAAAVAELAVAVRITPEFYIGGGFQSLFFSLNNRTVLASCPQISCSPEDPGFDTLAQVKVVAPFVPSANFGLLYVNRWVRIGASVQLPYNVHGSGTVKTRLPSDPQFDGAVVVGDRIDVDLALPLTLRAGVEVRPHKQVRVEVGGDFEMWSVQRTLEFKPQGVYIDHIAGIGRYELRPMRLDRGMRDSFSAHIGGEFDVLPKRLTVRAGYLYESSAVPLEYLSVLTPDGNKHLVSIGGSVRIGTWRLDVAYAHIFQQDRIVSMSKSLQLNPIQPSIAVSVGEGRYEVRDDILSVGVEKRF